MQAAAGFLLKKKTKQKKKKKEKEDGVSGDGSKRAPRLR